MRATSSDKTTTSDRLTTVLSYGALLLLGYVVFLIFEPFLVPLAWSAVLAIFFFPLHEKLKARMGPTQAALLSTVGVTLLLIVPALLILLYTTREALDAMTHLQTSLQNPDQTFSSHAAIWLRNHLPVAWRNMDFSVPLQQGAEKVAAYVAGSFGYLVKHLFTFFLHLFILLFALFFMFRDGEEIARGVRHLFPFDEGIQNDMMHESKELIFASVAVALLIAVIQGVLGGVTLAVAGLATPIFWGVLIAFLSMVPVVGSALVWFPAALWLGFNGHWGKALLVLAVCGGVVTIADNIVRPMLLRNRTHLNELLLFISVLGGLEVFGMLGLVAGPTIVAAAMGVFRVYMEHRDKPEIAQA
jgi:predicted PurR-regulated permease PerM